MPKIPMSNMTSDEFLTFLGALKLKNYQLAEKLSCSHQMVSHYRTGRQPIPTHVAERLCDLVVEAAQQHTSMAAAEAKRLANGAFSAGQLQRNKLMGLVAKVNIATNDKLIAARQASSQPPTPRNGIDGRFPNCTPKGRTPFELASDRERLTSPLPRYDVNRRYSALLVRALIEHHQYVEALSRMPAYSSTKHQDDHKHERHNIKCVLENIPKDARGLSGVPFPLIVTEAEWHTISRALRRLGDKPETKQARSLYQHWRKHKFVGYSRIKNLVPAND